MPAHRNLYRSRLSAVLLCVAAATCAGAGPITISVVTNPDFGTLMGGPAGRNFILTTTGTISGADAGDYMYGAVAGMVNIVTDNNAAIDILATNLTANGGVTIVNVTCDYHNLGEMDCDQGFTTIGRKGKGRDMTIGLEINTTQVHDDVTAAPGFDIVINYP